MKAHFWRAVSFVLLYSMAAVALAADATRYRALLVGVSDYPALAGKNLKGPREDVARMAAELARRGLSPSDIVVLTESDDPKRLPTRQRILDELASLARTAKPDDYIIVMMAGHGSRVPVPANSPIQEPDGLFEVFLPRDVSGWDDRANGGAGDVVNAIKDHEIRAMVDQMVDKGAFVWAIFDACHSATLVRGGDVVLRQVEPTDLRIPQQRVADAERRARVNPKRPGRSDAVADKGRAVFFYAAQTTEQAPEMQLPREVPGSPVQGLFSFSVIRALESGVPMTYRQLSQYVLMYYAATPEARSVTPAFSGGRGLDAPVLGSQATAVQQWPLVRDASTYKMKPEIKAGVLAQVRPGATFALFKTALDTDALALGQAVVVRAGVSEAKLAVLDSRGVPNESLPLPEGAAVARLVKGVTDFSIAIATDLQRCAAPCVFVPALAELGKSGVPGVSARWAAAGEAADLALRADGRRLWLQPAGLDPAQECRSRKGTEAQQCVQRLERMYVHIDAEASAETANVREAIATALHRAARATNLMRIARDQVSASATQRLVVSVTPLGAAKSSGAISRRPGAATFKQGTQVRVDIRNEPGTGGRRRAMDVTALWIDSKYGIGALWPLGGDYNRIESGTTLSFEVNIDQGDQATLGTEFLAIIGVEAEPHTSQQEFTFLAQPASAQDWSKVTIRGDGDARALFVDAGFANFQTRSGSAPPPAPAGVGMQVLSLRIVP